MPETKDDVPPMFYKYRSMTGESAQWVERTVLQNEIYFAPASSFNDPFDLRPVFSLDANPARQKDDFLRMSKKFEPHLSESERLSEARRVMETSLSAENIEHTTAAIQELHAHYLSTNVGILCVSTKRDDILMWSHYADSHRGVCLEFDGMFAFMAHAQKVMYTHSRIPINPYEDDSNAMMEKALLTKSANWSYESEWRLCRYENGPGVVQFRPQNLTGIIIGALANTATQQKVKEWAKKRVTPIRLYQASTNGRKFELDIKQI